MVQTLEAIKGGGGSVKVGTTGTISALMSRELQSVKDGSSDQVPSIVKSRKTAILEPNDATTGTRLKARAQADVASTSCSSSSNSYNNNTNGKHTDISQKTKHHHTRKPSQNPILHSDNVSIDGTPNRRKPEKKGPHIVQVVDIKCGMPDRTWANPITNRLKKLSFSKLSETNGMN